ncbi:MAG: hypothetical protein GXO32_03415 [Crenarchaeota archaeon]|nr:hypothetical protein [Thermoproteota archaeon]
MRLSVYSLSDALMSFGLVQFEEREVGEVRRALESMDLESVERALRSAGIELEEITIARGTRYRGSWSAPVIYMSVLGSSKKYWLEILDEFADFVCNDSVVEAVNTIVRILASLSPHVKMPRGRTMLGVV